MSGTSKPQTFQLHTCNSVFFGLELTLTLKIWLHHVKPASISSSSNSTNHWDQPLHCHMPGRFSLEICSLLTDMNTCWLLTSTARCSLCTVSQWDSQMCQNSLHTERDVCRIWDSQDVQNGQWTMVCQGILYKLSQIVAVPACHQHSPSCTSKCICWMYGVHCQELTKLCQMLRPRSLQCNCFSPLDAR